ncbi:MAG TPA: 3-hydroxyisobutyrate dehydrogenase [Solirubrobacterales bacterium]|nr:3-hydroxyisobutyrate dehydrogenase [Solirubrobacterales bacterium]
MNGADRPWIGFVGLGRMGGPMAANLVATGHRVRGFDVVPEACEVAAATGVEIAAGVAEVAAAAEVVVTMLPNGGLVRGCYAGEAGILAAARPGCLLIDCSTIDVFEARELQADARGAGMRAIDAPVSGGVVGATAATLTFMAGGEAEEVAAAEPALLAMGSRVVHCGPSGAGQAAKACNNMLLAISMIGTAEAFALAERLGLSDQALFDVASTSSGRCWALDTNCPVPGPVPTSPANRDYEPGFAIDLMVKDLRLADAAVRSTGAVTELGRHATEIYERLAERGMGGRDFSVVYRAIVEGEEDRGGAA